MKEKLKLLGLECIYFIAVTVAAAAGALLQFVGRIHKDDYRNLFAGSIYYYNIAVYMLGLLLFPGVVYFVYVKRFKKTVEKFKKESGFMKFCYVLLAVLFSAALFAVLIICDLFMLGLNDLMEPEALFYCTVFGWPAGLMIFMMTVLWRRTPSSVSPAD